MLTNDKHLRRPEKEKNTRTRTTKKARLKDTSIHSSRHTIIIARQSYKIIQKRTSQQTQTKNTTTKNTTTKMNIRHEKRKNTQNRAWKKKPNNEDILELQRNSKIIKEKIKTGFKNESSLADIEKSLNSMIDVSIVLARHLVTRNVVRSLLGAIRILLNKPEAAVMQDDLLD